MDLNPEDECRRHSYHNRIDDDLSEVILQFLGIKDKVKLECVSKQFRRTIFPKQYRLRLSDFGADLKSWESVLKKCPNVKSIELNETNDPIFVNKFLELVFKYFNNSIELKFNFRQITENLIERVVQKYGSKAVSYLRYNQNIKCLNSLIDIKEINFNYFQLSSKQLNEYKFNDLRKVWIYLYDKEVIDLQTFVSNHRTITNLNISIFISDENVVKLVLNAISGLNRLIHLQIWTEIGLNEECFETSVKQIANNCPKLKSIECHLNINSVDINTNDLLSSFKPFERLKRFNLFISSKLSPDIKSFSLKPFKSFRYLTHLTLKFLHLASLEPSILEDIDTNLPKLQYLVIPNPLEATEETKLILSRLSRLETIKMNVTNESIRCSLEELLRKKCPNILSIDLKVDQRLQLYSITY